MGTFVNRKTTRAWRSTPSWAPGPACPVPSLSCPSPGCWGVFPGMAPLPSLSCPSPRCRGALPRKAPLPSLSCPSLGCRGALSSWPPCPDCSAHSLSVGAPSPAGPLTSWPPHVPPPGQSTHPLSVGVPFSSPAEPWGWHLASCLPWGSAVAEVPLRPCSRL